MKITKALLSTSVLLVLSFSQALAAPIAVSGHFAEPNFGVPSGTLTETNVPFATDGNIATGYVATASPGTVNQSQGIRVRWDFDVSGFASISSFTFNFDGILNDPSTADQLRIGASPFSNFVVISAPDGVPVSSTRLLTPGAGIGADNLNNYISGGVLSVWIQTQFGTGPASFGATTLTTLEVSADIVGVAVDSDGDGVPNDDDFCPNTIIPESVPTRSLGVNRFALVDGDDTFDTTSPKGKGPGRSYSTTDTAGCSCTQIIEAQGLGKGHTKFGCSISAMDDWVELVTP